MNCWAKKNINFFRIWAILIPGMLGFNCKVGVAQDSFGEFLKELPQLHFPFVIDSIHVPDSVMINRHECWNYFLLPAASWNARYPDSNEVFSIDTLMITAYQQWDSADWNKKETLPYYCPVLLGNFYAGGSLKFSNGIVGIIWMVDQKAPVYWGVGQLAYLFTYSSTGKPVSCLNIFDDRSGGEFYWHIDLSSSISPTGFISQNIFIQHTDWETQEITTRKSERVYQISETGEFIKN